MEQVFAVLVFAVVALGGAGVSVAEHYHMIHHGHMSAGVKRDWTIARGVLLGLLSMGALLVGVVDLWSALALFAGSWCAYTFIFRRGLNKSMKWDRHYLGGSSRYDATCIAVMFFMQTWRIPNVEGIMATHDGAWQHSMVYRTTVRKAEVLASVVELSIAAMAVALTLSKALSK